MPPIVTDRVAWSVGLSVSPAKTAEEIEIPFALRTRVGPRNHLLDIAERFQSNTILWAFYTIQPSSLRICLTFLQMLHLLRTVPFTVLLYRSVPSVLSLFATAEPIVPNVC